MIRSTDPFAFVICQELLERSWFAEDNHVLKQTEAKATAQRQEQMAHEQKLKEMEVQQRLAEKKMQLDHETLEAEKDRRKDLLVAEIKASGYGAMQDLNSNAQSDFMDQMEIIKSSEEFQQTMSFEQGKESTKTRLAAEKNQLAKEKLQAQVAMKNMDLQIAKENKNQFDVKAALKKKEQDKKKK